MKNSICLALALVLPGCATTGTQMQAECEAQHVKFPDIYRCTYDNIAKRNPSILQNEHAKLYMLRGARLAEMVEGKDLDDSYAKIRWQQDYIDMKNDLNNESANNYRALGNAMQGLAGGLNNASEIYRQRALMYSAPVNLPPPAPSYPAYTPPVHTHCTSYMRGSVHCVSN